MNSIRDYGRFAVALAAAIVTAAPALAADTSPWSDDIRSSVRLISGSIRDGMLTAGIEVKLQPGWKTYWRYPGDSGVPPRFDFSGSSNVASADVLYPAPHAFTDETGTSIGYKDRVIFPVSIKPGNPAKPVTLKLKIDYAVCEKVCIPAEGNAALAIGKSAEANKDLAAFQARVPKRVSPQDAGLTLRRTGGKLVGLDIASPEKQLEVFVEGPKADWALPIPKSAAGDPPGRFSFELDGLPPGTDPNGKLDLTFTIVSPERAIEITTRLD